MLKALFSTIFAAIILSACSEPTAKQPLQTDVPANRAYQQNLTECRIFATEMPTEEQRMRILKGSAKGGILGAVVADQGYSRAGAAAIGAVLVGGASAAAHKRELKKQQTEFVSHCMISRGQTLVE
ncbi:hypothetical protein C1J03_10885 [Sulfitobacter sp. SK012]|nr:hypothetical protein C1J03_10885 [Sulfitobacter sp. SK012]